jgi:hypothetical protein
MSLNLFDYASTQQPVVAGVFQSSDGEFTFAYPAQATPRRALLASDGCSAQNRRGQRCTVLAVDGPISLVRFDDDYEGWYHTANLKLLN